MGCMISAISECDFWWVYKVGDSEDPPSNEGSLLGGKTRDRVTIFNTSFISQTKMSATKIFLFNLVQFWLFLHRFCLFCFCCLQAMMKLILKTSMFLQGEKI